MCSSIYGKRISHFSANHLFKWTPIFFSISVVFLLHNNSNTKFINSSCFKNFIQNIGKCDKLRFPHFVGTSNHVLSAPSRHFDGRWQNSYAMCLNFKVEDCIRLEVCFRMQLLQRCYFL